VANHAWACQSFYTPNSLPAKERAIQSTLHHNQRDCAIHAQVKAPLQYLTPLHMALGPVCFCVSKAFLKKFENFLFFY
jgi:hypothetical protein